MAAIDDEVIHACENGDIPTLVQWLVRGGDPSQRDDDGHTLLRHVLFEGDRDDRSMMILVLAANGADVNEGTESEIDLNDHATRPLHYAMHLRETELLLDLGANVNALDGMLHATPLILTAGDDNLDRAKARARLLLRRGADVTSRCAFEGRDAERTALSFNRNDLADLFAAVKAAGSWPRYIRAPRVALVRLRLLCSRGRARPPNEPILARLFAAAPPVSSNCPLPNEIFWLVLSFWRTDRDD